MLAHLKENYPAWCSRCIIAHGAEMLTGYDSLHPAECRNCGNRSDLAIVINPKTGAPGTMTGRFTCTKSNLS